jgi:hypothetical protein
MKRFCLLLLGVLLFTGCGPSGPALPSKAKVGGTVTLDGQPMGGGEIRFGLEANPPQAMPISNGAFSGEAFVGKNRVEVVWDKDGPPHPMEAGKFIQVNAVDAQFSGPNTTLSADVPKEGKTDLKFEVTSAPK